MKVRQSWQSTFKGLVFGNDDSYWLGERTLAYNPIRLINRIMDSFLVLLFIRHHAGKWEIYLRSFAPKSQVDKITVKMRIFPFDGKKELKYAAFGYQGTMAYKGCGRLARSAIVISDNEALAFKTPKCLFAYHVNLGINH
jgi:hypothetical protein